MPRGWSCAWATHRRIPLRPLLLFGRGLSGDQGQGGAPPKLEGYGYDTGKAEMLPGGLTTALDAVEDDADLCELLGLEFVAAFLAYKRNEVDRFSHWVTDWSFASTATTSVTDIGSPRVASRPHHSVASRRDV